MVTVDRVDVGLVAMQFLAGVVEVLLPSDAHAILHLNGD